jgi:protease IV
MHLPHHRPTSAIVHPTVKIPHLGPSPEDAAAAAAQVAYAGAQVARLATNLAQGKRKAPDYLTFVLDGDWPELPAPRKWWQQFVMPGGDNLRSLRAQLNTVAADPRLKGVVLHLRPLEMPRAELETLRDLITTLRAAGKRVVVWSSRYTTTNYFVASAADEILLQPGGTVEPLGLRRTYLFLADALQRVGLEFDGIQISPFKSAVDIFTRHDMSDEVRSMVNWLIDSDYGQFLGAVAAGRGLDEAGARALADGAPYTDVRAIEAGAVDAIVAEEDLAAHLAIAGRPAVLESFAHARKRLFAPAPARPGRYVALLRIEGNIVDGRSAHPPTRPPGGVPFVTEPRAGDLTVVQEARRVLADKHAAALVVYIDSGGGSAAASEAMAAALGKVAAKKPVVAAMGPVAASGGYYVATPAQWIVAQPGTITGSIGVLSGKFVTGGLFDRLRFNRETISRGANTGLLDGERRFDEAERAIMWDGIRRIYDVFLDRVATSRGLSPEAVDAVGGGRVWTGRQALEHGLVDELGSLETALAKARALAGLSPRAPVVEVSTAKLPLAPVADPTALLGYVAESVRLLNRARAMCLCPIIWYDES